MNTQGQLTLIADKQLPQVHELPAGLRTVAFLRAWMDWQRYRIEIRHKLAPSTMQRQLKLLQSIGETRAIVTIELSISNGWRGLFPEKTLAAGLLASRPVWAQIKDAQELLCDVVNKLKLWELPNVLRYENGAQNAKYQAANKAALREREELRERKKALQRQLQDLKAKQAGGAS